MSDEQKEPKIEIVGDMPDEELRTYEALPDGKHPLRVVAVQQAVGTKYKSDEPQDKIVWTLECIGGAECGSQIQRTTNLPDVDASGKRAPMGRKNGTYLFMKMLAGGEPKTTNPNRYIGIKGLGIVEDGKLESFMPLDVEAESEPPAAEIENVPLSAEPVSPKPDSAYSSQMF